MAHITDWMALAKPSDEWEAAMSKLPQRPNLGQVKDIATLRKMIAEQKRRANVVFQIPGGIVEKDIEIPVRDGSKIPAKVYTPEGKTGCPVAVIYHGGGYCIGGLENEQALCTKTAAQLGGVVVNVSYRLAPEHKFPTAHHDGVDAAKWVGENISSYGGDTSKGFVLGGSSAGSGLAITTALTLRDEGFQPAITGLLLKIPPLIYFECVPEEWKADLGSWDQLEHADILTRDACVLFLDNYIPEHEDRRGKLFNPLLWPTGFKNFPPSYFQICGADPLRDEALFFERMLRVDEGIATKVEVYPGFPHGFPGVIPQLPTSKKFEQESLAGMKWLFEQHK